MKTEEAEFAALYAKFSAWKMSQADQQDGQEYERSFVGFCQELNRQLLLMATRPIEEESKKKS